MTRDDLFKLHETLCAKSLEIMKKKNQDYSKSTWNGNFMVCEALQAATAENGIIIRMGDKLSRLVSVLEKGALVEESIEDTVLDLVNYSILLWAVYSDKKRALNSGEGK